MAQLPRNDFPACATCPQVYTATPGICFNCVLANIPPTPDFQCDVCYQELSGPQDDCRNRLCRSSSRSISRIHAIAMDKPPLDQKVRMAKEYSHRGWGLIFGRLIVGWLDKKQRIGQYDLIVHNPDYVEPGAHWLGHTAEILSAAIKEDLFGLWPFVDPADPVMSLQAKPEKSRGNGLAEKQRIASQRVGLLTIKPGAVQDKRVLVVDDLNTTGAQLDAVACFLLGHGAIDVEGLVVARAGWR